mgnify:CR=1 FL=1
MNNAKGLTKVLAVLGAFVLLGLSGCGQEETVETDSSAQETTELTSETTTEETTEAAAEEHLDYENYHFEVLEMNTRRILKVKVIVDEPQVAEETK